MAETSIGVVIRQQAWFRSLVDTTGLELFSPEKANLLLVRPTSAFRVTVKIGRGPVVHDIAADCSLWFDHGELPYPTFQCPSIGPAGAGLYGTAKPRQLSVGADEALCLVDVSLIQPIPLSFQEEYERNPHADIADSPGSAVRAWLADAATWLEQAIGVYALYQYPIVWEPLAVQPVVGFLDLRATTFKLATRIEPDNFIPFRPKVAARVCDGQLSDGALGGLEAIADKRLHVPLLLLQRALWQKNVQLRFLETFLVLDYLTGQFDGEDDQRPNREELFNIIDRLIQEQHPEHLNRVRSIKQILLQAPLRERIGQYLRHLGVSCDEQTIRRMLRVRNDLAHARSVQARELADLEFEARRLVRDVMRRELESRGMTFDVAPSS